MSSCPRPIDVLDVEALAAGAEPVVEADAADHLRQCAACRERVEVAVRLTARLEPLFLADAPKIDLADRILRLRPFSRRERHDFALWRGALGLLCGVFFGGILLLVLPALTAGEQVSLGAAAVAPLAALLRSLAASVEQTLSAGPIGLEALAQVFRQQPAVGLGALALLAPALFGLRRAVARARR